MTDPYREFDPGEYLRQYYSTADLSGDERVVCDHIASSIAGRGRTFDSAIDVGCGPTVHHAFMLAPFAREVHLAEYLPANREAVRRWLDRDPAAFDLGPLLGGVLRAEGADPATLDDRVAELRAKVTAVRPLDLRRDDPLGDGSRYDLVASFFCAECVAADRAGWRAVMGRLLGMVKPGGAVFLATMRDCERYAVGDRWFPAARVTEADFPPLLAAHGFVNTVVEAVAVPDWAADGFAGIVIIRAEKGPGA